MKLKMQFREINKDKYQPINELAKMCVNKKFVDANDLDSAKCAAEMNDICFEVIQS